MIRALLARVICALSLVLCFALPRPAFAQTTKEKPDTSEVEEAPSLPQTAASASPATIDATNALEYRKILSPELYPLLRSGVISFAAFARARYEWNFGPAWTEGTKQSASHALTQDNGLCTDCRTNVGLPFGTADAVFSSGTANEQEHKILWNASATQFAYPVQRSSLSFLWYKQGKFYRDLHADLLRSFPARIPGVTSGTQLFRERLNFTEPRAIAPLSFFTLRFLGADEDFLWEFSPSIGKSRQLTGANRSDAFLGMPVSLDDLSVWNGKHEAIEADGISKATLLVPVAGISALTLAATPDACVSPQGFVLKSGGDAALLNTTVQQWVNQGRSPWNILSSLSFAVVRSVVRIETTANDPFSLYGRQVLTIDQESMLPLMKLVYDRSGHPWKLILASTAFASTADGSRTAALYPLMLVHDYLKDETVLIRQTDTTYCDNFTAKISAEDFDMKRFSEQGTTTADTGSEKGDGKEKGQKAAAAKSQPANVPAPSVRD